MLNYGFFDSRLFPKCTYCGKNNSRAHIVNECEEEFFVKLRKEYITKVYKYLNIGGKNNIDLNSGLNEIYFQPKDKRIAEGLKILKSFVAKIYIERPLLNDEDTE